MNHQEKIRKIQQIQDYIEENIGKPISLKDLASVSNYSPWYCSRVFKDILGISPFEYIRKLRISKAADCLLNNKKKVIDVAFDFVFDSHEGFTRAFSKQFGMSPRDYSKNGSAKNKFMPISIEEYYLKLHKGDVKVKDLKNQAVFVQVVDRPKRKAIIKRGVKATHYFEYGEEVDCEAVWETLGLIKDAINEPVGMWLPDKLIKKGTSKYVQGVEVPDNYSGDIPNGFELIELQESKMMMFQGPEYDDCKFGEAIGELWKVIDEYKPETFGFKWAVEDGPRIQLEPKGYRGYIEGRPVRSL